LYQINIELYFIISYRFFCLDFVIWPIPHWYNL
jgi:hypothetical protein